MFSAFSQMKELREQLSHSKRIGCLFGAGTSKAMGLPDILQLTKKVLDQLKGDEQKKLNIS